MTSTVKKCKNRVCLIKKHSLGKSHLDMIVIEVIDHVAYKFWPYDTEYM